jgi:hypothetical protein
MGVDVGNESTVGAEQTQKQRTGIRYISLLKCLLQLRGGNLIFNSLRVTTDQLKQRLELVSR